MKFNSIRKFHFCTNQPKKKGIMGMLQKYGKFGLTFYFSYWAITGIGFYFLFKYKYLDADKTIDWLERKGLNKVVDVKGFQKKIGDKYTNAIIAYAVNSLFEVVRLPTTLAFLAFWFKRRK